MVEFEEVVERAPVAGAYVLYEIGVSAEWADGGGDGINEPAYPGQWLIHATVLSAMVEYSCGVVKQYEKGDAVPECWVIPPGKDLELTEGEKEAFAALAEAEHDEIA